MAIDADLSSGLIDETEARRRRAELEQESSFFGSMDGASKFVRGDAIAGLIITFVNSFGGIIIGVTRHGMDFATAVTRSSNSRSVMAWLHKFRPLSFRSLRALLSPRAATRELPTAPSWHSLAVIRRH